MLPYTQMLIKLQFAISSLKGMFWHAINAFNGEMNHSISFRNDFVFLNKLDFVTSHYKTLLQV